ncbi:MAG: hypothetical protein HC772_02300 [Leptolyngbyaceae cyanobacterium CRU_2_3]|nr:hypothetical protein [Leptolyngbyaceae cyanobacterium CRU_2_3]
MIILTNQQTDLILGVLNAVLMGEDYRLSNVERAIEYLNNGCKVSCPLEKISQSAATRILADEIVQTLRGTQS